jgi:hypothetical protein
MEYTPNLFVFRVKEEVILAQDQFEILAHRLEREGGESGVVLFFTRVSVQADHSTLGFSQLARQVVLLDTDDFMINVF